MVQKKSMKIRKGEVLEILKNLGKQVYDQLLNENFPYVEIPSRSTKNIYYDEKLRQYVLGDKRVKRTTRNIRHLRPFTQLIWLADIAYQLINQGKTCTLRDIFYMSQAYEVDFVDQSESDDIITDLESIISYAREDFNVFPEERSAIYGDLTIEYTV
ncbi:MAG: DNA topoisomerase IV subunit A, partial [Candidatus Bathyarchaeota archaeon]|nr:DNA topoisomerase IV subunit A [Candidatus Bathyarchaeota archaeon]